VFHITRAIGSTMTVCLDEDQGRFLVASTRDLEEENPDVMEFSDVTGCHMDVEEHKTEIMREKPDGTKEHYFPPRYDTDYDLYVTINVNNPWFNEIRFRLNHSTIDQRGSAEFQNCQRDGNEIVDALTKARQNVRREAAAASAPKTAQTCPWCGATCIPDANGCCEYCGGAMKQ
jgi:ribosomal protein L32